MPPPIPMVIAVRTLMARSSALMSSVLWLATLSRRIGHPNLLTARFRSLRSFSQKWRNADGAVALPREQGAHL
jgi:hypothetical protein